jgi:hypothetical protein
MSEASSAVLFKSIKKKKNIRGRRKKKQEEEEEDGEREEEGEGEEESGFDRSALTEMMEKQKLRQRTIGISNITLASGRKVTRVEEMAEGDRASMEDPFKLKSGGLLDLKTARRARTAEEGEAEAAAAEEAARGAGIGVSEVVGTQFSKETRVRDEDEEMRKFIDVEMEKRRARKPGEAEEVEEERWVRAHRHKNCGGGIR